MKFESLIKEDVGAALSLNIYNQNKVLCPLSRRNHTVDIFRLFAAFAVVLLHVDYQSLPNELVLAFRWTGRWAVPFFFIVSGYFFHKNYSKSGDVALLKSLQNLIFIGLVANLVYLPFSISKRWGHWNEVFSLNLFSMNGHLWFINSLVVGLLIFWLLLKKKADRWMLPLAIVVITFSLLTNAYSLLLNLKTDRSFSMMVLSLPFLVIGYKVSESRLLERRLSVRGGVIMVFLGFTLQSFEILALYKLSGYGPHNQEFLLGTVLFSLGMFVLALKLKMPQMKNIAGYGRDYSLPIYLYHPLIIFFIATFIRALPLTYGRYLSWASPLLCVVFTFFLIRLMDQKFPKVFRFISGR